MPTAAKPRGKTANMLFGIQSAFDTPATGNYTRTPFYSENLGEAEPFEDDPLLGQERTNNRDTLAPASGLASLSGQIAVPLDLNHIAYWLTALLGAPVTTGTGPYTHTFASGGEVLPFYTIEIEKRAGAAFFQSIGCLADSFSFDTARSAGYRQANVNILGRNQVKLAATGGGAPVAMLARNPIAAAIGRVLIDDVEVGNFRGGSFQYNNNAAADDSLNGTKYSSGFELDADATCSGSARIRYANESYYDLMAAGDPFKFEFELAASATAKISFVMANARFEKGAFAPIGGPGGLEAEMNWRAEQSATDPMLTIAVTNGIESY